MGDIFLAILFFFTIFCFLTYSCTWFSRTYKRYQQEMARHRATEEVRRNCRISVYTIEEGSNRHTIVEARMPPPSYKEEELPPAYYEAIRMSNFQHENSTSTPPTLQNTQPRRNSATI